MSTQTLSARAMPNAIVQPATGQYSLGKILGVWALVALPMALLAWVVLPLISPHIPLYPGLVYWLLMIAGMAWQFIVGLVILYRELGTLRWSAIRERTWLQAPREPGTDRPNRRLYWWLVPALLFTGFVNLGIRQFLDAPLTWLFPALRAPAYLDMSALAQPEFVGQWWILGLALVSCAFNYFLGEEFLFRGVLLPKMQGAFGKYDWLVNAILFGLYHVHKPWSIPGNIVSAFAFTWPARRFRSNWMAVVVHGIEAIPVLLIVLSIMLGFLPG